MNLEKMTKEELELLPYTKIAELYLIENKTTKTTAELFKEVCKLLHLKEEDYENEITDFFQALSTSKEFILLNDGNWDLRANHKVKIDIDDIYEEKDEEELNTEEEGLDVEDEEFAGEEFDLNTDEDYEDDDLSDLTILNEDELE